MPKVLHASYSGYFPFCITKRDSVPTDDQGGTYYPIALTLEQAISLFWRVKKWTFQDTLTPTSQPFSLNRGNSSPLPESEDGLVCVDGYRYENVFYNDDGFDSFSQIIDFDLFSGQFISTSLRLLQIGSLYYPVLFFNGQFSDYSTGEFGAGVTLYSSSTPYEAGNFVINFLGYSISMKLYSGFDGIPYSASLNANEYWSYGGTYNTSTGQPITL
jgi:hypothetical protein